MQVWRKTPERIDADAVLRWLSSQAKQRERFGITTQNRYVVALKGFTRWLWASCVLDADPLRALRRPNAEADRRKQRRALTADDVRRLIETTQTKQKRLQRLSAERRSLLYAIAVTTGLRAAELASLRPSSFDLEAGTVTVAALVTKNRQTARLPLPPSLLPRLRDVLPTLDRHAPIFPGQWCKREAARMLRSDCKRADIDTTDVDFHGLRTTYITSLARAGIHPAIAQRLARRSTITLTMNVYTKLDDGEMRDAVVRLPAFV